MLTGTFDYETGPSHPRHKSFGFALYYLAQEYFRLGTKRLKLSLDSVALALKASPEV